VGANGSGQQKIKAAWIRRLLQWLSGFLLSDWGGSDWLRWHSGLRLGSLGLLAWRDDGVQNGAFHARHELNYARFTDVLNEAVDDVVAEVAMSHLAATEAEAGFDLVSAIEKLDGLVFLGLVVVLVDGD
jgi:hypothetical protein